ncbi:MAG: hypothetical protein CSA84_01235 [Actinomycetales bacterium]|nr:MAG: hypothetical protein CSA84_01235 [Actinomycetales bacterium]
MSWRGLRRLGPWWLVAVAGLTGLVLVGLHMVRFGGYFMSAALLLGAAMRALLSRPGGLAVRRKWVDVVSLLTLGTALLVAVALVRLDV